MKKIKLINEMKKIMGVKSLYSFLSVIQLFNYSVIIHNATLLPVEFPKLSLQDTRYPAR